MRLYCNNQHQYTPYPTCITSETRLNSVKQESVCDVLSYTTVYECGGNPPASDGQLTASYF